MANRGIKIAAGVAGAAALAAGAAWLFRTQRNLTVTTPAGLKLSVLSVSALADELVTAEIEVTNPGDLAQTVAVSGSIENTGVNFMAKSVTLAPGETKQITMQSADVIAAQFVEQLLEAVFSTSDGAEVRATFRVEGLPEFEIRVISITDPTQVGEVASAIIEITNVGNITGTIEITGETQQNGVRQGGWV